MAASAGSEPLALCRALAEPAWRRAAVCQPAVGGSVYLRRRMLRVRLAPTRTCACTTSPSGYKYSYFVVSLGRNAGCSVEHPALRVRNAVATRARRQRGRKGSQALVFTSSRSRRTTAPTVGSSSAALSGPKLFLAGIVRHDQPRDELSGRPNAGALSERSARSHARGKYICPPDPRTQRTAWRRPRR